MKRLCVPAIIVLLISIDARPAAAQRTVKVSIDEAVARALEDGLEVAESEADIEAAKAAHRAAKALYGPRLVELCAGG